MLESIRWVKPALATKDIVLPMKYLLFKDGMVSAYNGRISASAPVDFDKECLVNGQEFQSLMERLQGSEIKISMQEEVLKASAGRYRGSVKTLDPALWDFPSPGEKWEPVVPGLIEAFALLRPFLSENATKPWAMCACLRHGKLYATSNISCARVEVPVQMQEDILIPCWAIDFVLAKATPPVEWQYGEEFIAFKWEDGSWMRAHSVKDQFPNGIETIFTGAQALAKESVPTSLTQEIREHFRYIFELGEEHLSITPSRIATKKSTADYQVEIPSEVTKDTHWNKVFLKPVIEAADQVWFNGWPKGCYFRSEKMDGVVMGRRE